MRLRLSFASAVVVASLLPITGVADAQEATYSGTVEGVCTEGEPSIRVTNTGTGDIVVLAAPQQQLIQAGSDPVELFWPSVQETLLPDVSWSLLRVDNEEQIASGTLTLDEVCPPEQESTTTTEPAPTTTQPATTTTEPATATTQPTTTAPVTTAPPTTGVDVNATLPATGPPPTTTLWLVVAAGALLMAGAAMRFVRRPTG